MTAEIVFSSDEGQRFERDLARIDRQLRALAREFACTYYTTGGRGWPGRRLRRRRGLRTYELKLILNPNYLDDERLFYELREQWMYDFGEILTKMLSHRLIATFEAEDLHGETLAGVAARHLASALENRRSAQ